MKADTAAEGARLAEMAISSPAATAACEIAAAAWNHESFPLLGFYHRVWTVDESLDDYADVRVAWTSEGQAYQLGLTFNVVTGEGGACLTVDGRRVMSIRVEMCGWEKPPRIDGSRLPEDMASPDGKIRGRVTGADRYQPGPWEKILVGVAQQLRQVTAG